MIQTIAGNLTTLIMVVAGIGAVISIFAGLCFLPVKGARKYGIWMLACAALIIISILVGMAQ